MHMLLNVTKFSLKAYVIHPQQICSAKIDRDNMTPVYTE